ncbi:unnamed protein product [Rotaria sordida]|uniref:DYW domain-containing protein n=1 Tax=Rotaria sordida TaxID=392033 RepID=A0A815IJ67_9BILA|nr:unnamed protein product [Rotaria sordida]
MLSIRNNIYSIYRFQRVLSFYQKNKRICSNSSSIQLNSKLKKLFDSKQYKEALELFDQKFEECTDFTISMGIKACTISKDYNRGIKIERNLSSNSINNSYIQASLIQFHSLISNNMPEKVLDLFDEITIEANKYTVTVLFNACAALANNRARKIGKKLLDKMPENLRNDNIVLTSAIHMLIKFGDIQNAENLFQSIKKKDIITYGAMMKGYIENQMSEKALNVFKQINIELDNRTYAIVFNACAELANDRAIKIGKKVLGEMPRNFRNDNVVLTSAINMLIKFGDIQNAENLFQSIKKKDIITYGAMMKGYVKNQMSEKALDLIEQIELNLNNVAYTIAFNACAELANDRAMKIGKKLLDELPENLRNNNVVLNSAIQMLIKFGDIQNAENLFQSIKKKDIITYGVLMNGYVKKQMSEKALDLFQQIELDLNNYACTIVFNACAELTNDRAMKIGKTLLDELPENLRNDNIVLTSAIHMLMKFGDIQNAENVFQSIKKKDTGTYGALMNGYNINGLSRKCFKILEEMFEENISPDEIIWSIVINVCSRYRSLCRSQYIINQIPSEFQNKKQIQNSLIRMWGECSSIEKAENVFESIVDRDAITYTAMINAFGLNGMGSEAIQLYRKMPNNLRNEVSHICVLNACSHSGLLQEAWSIFNDIPIKTEKIFTTMVDCLSRLFLFDEAENLINEYEKTNKPSLVMYMSLLSGARNNRNQNLSEMIYNRMKSMFPNEKDHLISGAILLANIYSSLGEHELAKTFRYNQIKELKTNVKPGLTWTEEFTAHDNSHPKSAKISSELQRLTSEAIADGYQCDPSWVTRPLKQGETNLSVLCGHSERIAIAYNFVEEPDTKFIQIIMNQDVDDEDLHLLSENNLSLTSTSYTNKTFIQYCGYSDWLQFEHQEQNDEEDIVLFTDKIVALYSILAKHVNIAVCILLETFTQFDEQLEKDIFDFVIQQTILHRQDWPYEADANLLRLILKIIDLADHFSCAILANVKHLFNRLLTIKSIPVVQQVYQTILAEMTTNLNILLQALQQKAIVIGSETLSSPTTSDLNKDDAETALIFYCSALC